MPNIIKKLNFKKTMYLIVLYLHLYIFGRYLPINSNIDTNNKTRLTMFDLLKLL